MGRAAAIGLGLGVMLGSLAGCGTHHGAGGHGGGGSARPSVGLLATIPDTAATRRNVVEDDPSWLGNATQMRKQWCAPTKGSGPAQRMALANASPEGSPLGSLLLNGPYVGPKPLGYRPAAATEELTVGNPPDQLTVVRVPIPKSTESDLQRLGYRRQPDVDGHATLRSTGLHLTHASPIQTWLVEIKTIELSPVLIAGGWSGVTPAALAAVLDDRQAKHPLSADPDLDAVSSALAGAGPSADSPVEVMGSSLLVSPLGAVGGNNMTPAEVANLVRRFGLSRLKTPATYAGFRYVTGGHPACRVAAAAVYPTPAAAKTAAGVLGRVLRNGTSLSANRPYRSLWTVQSVTAHGDAVVARLSLRSPYALIETLQRNDFPLFWQPPVVARS